MYYIEVIHIPSVVPYLESSFYHIVKLVQIDIAEELTGEVADRQSDALWLAKQALGRWQQPPIPDWTAQLVPNATINDLDELAVATAKVMFKKVRSSSIPAEEINAWSTEEFLANSMMMREGKITRAAILLLGKPLSIQKIHPAVAQITWTWEDEEGIVQDYEHFTILSICSLNQNAFLPLKTTTRLPLHSMAALPISWSNMSTFSIVQLILVLLLPCLHLSHR